MTRVVPLAAVAVRPVARGLKRREPSAPIERTTDVGSVVASLLGQVKAVAAFADGDDEARGEGDAAAAADDEADGAGEAPLVRTGLGDDEPPPPHAASKDVVTSIVAILRNIAILIVKSGGSPGAQRMSGRSLIVFVTLPA